MQNTKVLKIKNFTNLAVWKISHSLVLAVYIDTKRFPDDERFALISQMRRASISITSNIAEGFGRKSPKDKAHFYQMSLSSLYELHSQLCVAKDLKFISQEEFEGYDSRVTVVSKLLNGILKSTLSPMIQNS